MASIVYLTRSPEIGRLLDESVVLQCLLVQKSFTYRNMMTTVVPSVIVATSKKTKEERSYFFREKQHSQRTNVDFPYT